MGDVFSLGFGPFRWVCTSGSAEDLKATDAIAAETFRSLMGHANEKAAEQYADNYKWIIEAFENKMVVGSQARNGCNGTRWSSAARRVTDVTEQDGSRQPGA